jgi:hypothetical protein
METDNGPDLEAMAWRQAPLNGNSGIKSAHHATQHLSTSQEQRTTITWITFPLLVFLIGALVQVRRQRRVVSKELLSITAEYHIARATDSSALHPYSRSRGDHVGTGILHPRGARRGGECCAQRPRRDLTCLRRDADGPAF